MMSATKSGVAELGLARDAAIVLPGGNVTPIQAIALLSAAAGLGLFLGWLYLCGVRRPVLVGAHLLLGVGGIETMVMLLGGAPNGDVAPSGLLGPVAAGLLAGALLSGLATPLVARQSRTTANVALATHAGLGLAGFIVFLAWVASF